MFGNALKAVVGFAVAMVMASHAFGADLYEPPIYEAPPPVYQASPEVGGWYLRGDVDYHWLKYRGGDYITYGCPAPCSSPTPGTGSFDVGKLKGALSAGVGVGYKVNRHFRTDFTGDYWFKSDFTGNTSGPSCGGAGPCMSVDESEMSALVLLANAYADLGTYNRVTPYIGAGIGGAHVKWGELSNTIGGGTAVHAGADNWRFAWALTAGASYCVNRNWSVDVGYRYTRVEGGRMFEEYSPGGASNGVGPGFDRGIDAHEARAGLRYSFGGGNDCGAPAEIAYEPEPVMPVYK